MGRDIVLYLCKSHVPRQEVVTWCLLILCHHLISVDQEYSRRPSAFKLCSLLQTTANGPYTGMEKLLVMPLYAMLSRGFNSRMSVQSHGMCYSDCCTCGSPTETVLIATSVAYSKQEKTLYQLPMQHHGPHQLPNSSTDKQLPEVGPLYKRQI
jgi:hypothetical protein